MDASWDMKPPDPTTPTHICKDSIRWGAVASILTVFWTRGFLFPMSNQHRIKEGTKNRLRETPSGKVLKPFSKKLPYMRKPSMEKKNNPFLDPSPETLLKIKIRILIYIQASHIFWNCKDPFLPSQVQPLPDVEGSRDSCAQLNPVFFFVVWPLTTCLATHRRHTNTL